MFVFMLSHWKMCAQLWKRCRSSSCVWLWLRTFKCFHGAQRLGSTLSAAAPLGFSLPGFWGSCQIQSHSTVLKKSPQLSVEDGQRVKCAGTVGRSHDTEKPPEKTALSWNFKKKWLLLVLDKIQTIEWKNSVAYITKNLLCTLFYVISCNFTKLLTGGWLQMIVLPVECSYRTLHLHPVVKDSHISSAQSLQWIMITTKDNTIKTGIKTQVKFIYVRHISETRELIVLYISKRLYN